MTKPLSYAAFFFMIVAVVGAAFEKVDFHNTASIITATVAASTALAGLCMHPPWAAQNSPANVNEVTDKGVSGTER